MPTQSLEYQRFLAWQDAMRTEIKPPFQRFLESVADRLRALVS